jgi:hypothetical protein
MRAWIARATVAMAICLLPGQAIAAPPDFELPAVELRVALDRALGEHAFLVIELMRTGVAGDAEFEVVAESVEANSVDIVNMIDSVYGPDAGAAFGEQWRSHIAYLVDYTRAVAAGDEDAQGLADSQLETYVTEFSELLASAAPGLPEDVVHGLIGEHRQQLQQIAGLGAGDYAGSYPALRSTYAHMFMIGDGLALAITDQFPDRFEGKSVAFSPAVDVRVTLDRLFGEHTYLAALVMRARLAQSADLEAAVQALNANSAELRDVIEGVYGADAAAAFDDLWRSHVDLYVAYVAAVSEGDEAAAQAALDGLSDYRTEFGAFVAGANPFLEAEVLEDLLQVHTDHLVAQVLDYRDGDYAAAYETLRQGYAHTAELAAGLGGAIAEQFPLLFPDTAMRSVPDHGVVVSRWSASQRPV